MATFQPDTVRMDDETQLKWIVRVGVLLLSAYWFFGVMLPNAGPFPEMQDTAEAARRAEEIWGRFWRMYILGYSASTILILLGATLKSRWEILGWIVLVALYLYPVAFK